MISQDKNSYLHVNALVPEPRVEHFRILFPQHVELQTQIRVQPDAEVVVHDEDVSVVLAGLRVGHGEGLAVHALHLVRALGAEHNGPSGKGSNVITVESRYNNICCLIFYVLRTFLPADRFVNLLQKDFAITIYFSVTIFLAYRYSENRLY